MGKKKQRKGAPDLDDDEFPAPSEAPAIVDADTPGVSAAAPKKQDKKKKAKKVTFMARIACRGVSGIVANPGIPMFIAVSRERRKILAGVRMTKQLECFQLT